MSGDNSILGGGQNGGVKTPVTVPPFVYGIMKTGISLLRQSVMYCVVACKVLCVPLFNSPVGSLCHTHILDIKSLFGANVHHVPGLCLLGIGGTPYIIHKIMAQKPFFHILTSETTSRWRYILCRNIVLI